MYRKLLIGLSCLLLAARSLSAGTFDDANRMFHSGDFAGAAAAYEKVLTTEGPRASVYYNLGNCYQSLKHYGPAILAYERAKAITPRDPDLSANLALARKAAAAFEDPGPFPPLDAAVHYLSLNEWSWLVAGGALVIGGLAVVWGAVKLPLRFRVAAVASAGIAGLAMVAGANALVLRHGEAARGVILSENAAVLLSPFEKAESLGTPGQGRMVQVGRSAGDFRYIEVHGSNLRGWLASKDVDLVLRGE